MGRYAFHKMDFRGIEGNNLFQDEEDQKTFVDRIKLLVKETKNLKEREPVGLPFLVF
ncbi:MAG: hypothetical protein WA974_00205 [Thermodesulfobacteriota bacterium]